MRVVGDPDELELSSPVVSIGNFDGVHWGHRQLLSRMRELAISEDHPSLVITFFPPSKVLFGNQPFLCSAREKLELLSSFEPAAVALIEFSLAYAQTDKQEFVAQLERLEPSTIIVGEDFRFGHKRQGTLNDLSLVTGKLEVFGLEQLGGEVVKSSTIRELLQAGEVERAATLLGRPYLLIGTVVAGDGRGRELGFPTANIELQEQKALPNGVFTVRVDTGDGSYGGMINCGSRPSFPESEPDCEVHLFDFDGDLYGRELRISFLMRIRGQQRFSSLDELRAQLNQDERLAREQLAGFDR